MSYVSSWQGFSLSGLNFSGQLAFPTFHKTLTHIHDHFIPHEQNNYHPHIFSHRFLGLLSLLLVTAKVSMIASLALSPVVTYSSAITIDNVVSLTNASRADYQASDLKLNAKLSLAAQNKANDMAAKGYFSHNTPDGQTPWSFIQASGYQYLSAGENLAVDFTQAEAVDVAWMNSPGHRANILNKNFQEIGIGIAQGEFQGHNTTFVVQMFGSPVAQQVALQDKPTQVAQAAPASVPVPQPKPAVSPTPAPTPTKAISTVADASTPTPITAIPEVEIAAVPQAATPVVIVDTSIDMQADQLSMTVVTSGPASRVVATFNNSAVMFNPKSDTTWQATVPWASLQSEATLSVVASDIEGNSTRSEVISFTPSLQKNYQFLGEVKGAVINFFGNAIDVKNVEQKFYLIIVTAILVCLIMAIAIHKHIQHVALVANGSFVVILAMFLWMAG